MLILQAESVIKQYRQYDEVIYAVNRASLKVEDGEFVAIMGASGSGKSTFLHVMAGLIRPDYGHEDKSNDITEMSQDELNRFRGQFIEWFSKHNLIPS